MRSAARVLLACLLALAGPLTAQEIVIRGHITKAGAENIDLPSVCIACTVGAPVTMRLTLARYDSAGENYPLSNRHVNAFTVTIGTQSWSSSYGTVYERTPGTDLQHLTDFTDGSGIGDASFQEKNALLVGSHLFTKGVQKPVWYAILDTRIWAAGRPHPRDMLLRQGTLNTGVSYWAEITIDRIENGCSYEVADAVGNVTSDRCIDVKVKREKEETECRTNRTLPGDAWVVRGGTNLIEVWFGASGSWLDADGNRQGVSVQSAAGKNVVELSAYLTRWKQVGRNKVAAVRAAGGNVYPSPGEGFHATLCGLTDDVASSLFTPAIANPARP